MFQTAIRLLYPPRCLSCGAMVDSDFGLCGPCWAETPFIGGATCDSCASPLPGQPDGYRLECDACMGDPKPWVSGRAALLYRDRARKLVLGLKHGDRSEIARPAALWMKQAARDLLNDAMIVAPVPLHRTRLLKRRYNQSALLSYALADMAGLAHCPDLLLRQRATPSQDGKTAAERAENLRDAIVVHPRRLDRLRDRPVLLVDDVMTSGATLGAATRACLEAGSGPVCVVVLARVDRAY
jgi:predicted amidophosphoribosyltransferase